MPTLRLVIWLPMAGLVFQVMPVTACPVPVPSTQVMSETPETAMVLAAVTAFPKIRSLAEVTVPARR